MSIGRHPRISTIPLTGAPSDATGWAAAAIVAGDVAHTTLEGRFAREVLTLRRRVAEQARELADAAEQIEEFAHARARGNAERTEAFALAERLKQRTQAEERQPAGDRPELYYGHGRQLIVTQEDGKFSERPMTAVEAAAIAPSRAMAADIHRHAFYAGCCYIWIWEKIVATFGGWVSPEEHDRRVTELLAANNREVETRRALAAAASRVVAERFSTFKSRNGRDVGVEDTSGEKCWIVPFEAMAELERVLTNPAEAREALDAPLPFKPTHRHYKGGLYEFLCWANMEADMSPVAVYRNEVGNVFIRPQSQWADKVNGKPRFEKISQEAADARS